MKWILRDSVGSDSIGNIMKRYNVAWHGRRPFRWVRRPLYLYEMATGDRLARLVAGPFWSRAAAEAEALMREAFYGNSKIDSSIALACWPAEDLYVVKPRKGDGHEPVSALLSRMPRADGAGRLQGQPSAADLQQSNMLGVARSLDDGPPVLAPERSSDQGGQDGSA